jgi:hypothetical protein
MTQFRLTHIIAMILLLTVNIQAVAATMMKCDMAQSRHTVSSGTMNHAAMPTMVSAEDHSMHVSMNHAGHSDNANKGNSADCCGLSCDCPDSLCSFHLVLFTQLPHQEVEQPESTSYDFGDSSPIQTTSSLYRPPIFS